MSSKSNLRVLHIIPELGKGGAERLVLNIVAELSKRKNISAKLITFRSNNAYPFLTENIDWEVVPARLLPSITGQSIIEIEALKQAIRSYQPNIIHTHLFEAEIISKEIILEGVTYFTHFHDNMPPFRKLSFNTFFNKDKLLRYFEGRWVLSKYSRCKNYFISISKDGEKYLKKNLPKYLQEKILLLPNAIDISRFTQNKRYEKAKSEPWKLVTIGSLISRKGHIFLIDVVKLLSDKGYNIDFKILGGGKEKDTLINKIQSLQLGNSVELVGYTEFPEEYLKQADIYLHAALHEPFGLVLVEAMATGLPVITTDGKGNRDLIEEGKNGFMIKERDVEIFSDKIIKLIEDKNLQIQLGQYAAEFSKKYSIENYIDYLLEIYNKKAFPI